MDIVSKLQHIAARLDRTAADSLDMDAIEKAFRQGVHGWHITTTGSSATSLDLHLKREASDATLNIDAATTPVVISISARGSKSSLKSRKESATDIAKQAVDLFKEFADEEFSLAARRASTLAYVNLIDAQGISGGFLGFVMIRLPLKKLPERADLRESAIDGARTFTWNELKHILQPAFKTPLERLHYTIGSGEDSPGSETGYVSARIAFKEADLSPGGIDAVRKAARVYAQKARVTFKDKFRTASARTASNIEYIVWGVPPGEQHENVLYTKATSMPEAKRVIKVLEEKHGCTKCHVQVLDLSKTPDFTKVFGSDKRANTDHYVQLMQGHGNIQGEIVIRIPYPFKDLGGASNAQRTNAFNKARKYLIKEIDMMVGSEFKRGAIDINTGAGLDYAGNGWAEANVPFRHGALIKEDIEALKEACRNLAHVLRVPFFNDFR